jgi:6-phosphogluconolactonase
MSDIESHVSADAEALAHDAAEFLTTTLAGLPGPSRVCLSGGSTPKRLYELLAAPPFRDRLPWDRVHWFWGDERCVPKDHPDSNYRMTRLAMFASVPVPAGHIHAIPTEESPEAAAACYEGVLRAHYGAAILDPARPLFDITLLGMGEDGHTASLFPGTAALAERHRWAAAVIGAKPEPRVTLTYPALNASRHVVFLLAGAGKHAMLTRVRAGEDLPAAHIQPSGTLHWMLDQAAATGRAQP